jgi:hypothetical protein
MHRTRIAPERAVVSQGGFRVGLKLRRLCLVPLGALDNLLRR